MDQLLAQLIGQLRAIWLRRFWGLAVAWLVAVAGLSYSLLVPSQYEANAQVYVDTESVLKPLMAGLAVQPNVDQQVEILSRTLLSRTNVDRLVRRAELDLNVRDDQDRSEIIDRVTRQVQVSSSKDNLFQLSYRDADPKRAMRTIDALLSIFVESGVANKRRDTDKARQFLDTQIEEYERVLSEAERRLKQFKLDNFEHLGTAQDSVAGMMTMDGEIEKMRTELRAAEHRRDAVRRQLEGEVPLFRSQQADARREALQRNLDDLRMKYTEDHPDVVNARGLLAAHDEEQRAKPQAQREAGGPGSTSQPNVAYQQLKVALAEAEGKVAELRVTVDGLQARYSRARASAKLRPELDEQLAQLNREYQVQKHNFEQLVARRESAKLTGQLDASAAVDFKVIDAPRVSSTPVAPNRLKLVVTVLIISLALGVGASYAVSQILPTVAATSELQAVAQRPVLGAVSYHLTPIAVRKRRRSHFLFAGAATGLMALFAVALAIILGVSRFG